MLNHLRELASYWIKSAALDESQKSPVRMYEEGRDEEYRRYARPRRFASSPVLARSRIAQRELMTRSRIRKRSLRNDSFAPHVCRSRKVFIGPEADIAGTAKKVAVAPFRDPPAIAGNVALRTESGCPVNGRPGVPSVAAKFCRSK